MTDINHQYYGELKIRANNEIIRTERIYVSLSVLLGEIGGLSSMYMTMFYVFNILVNEMSKNFSLLKTTLSEDYAKKQNLRNMAQILYYKAVSICCIIFCFKCRTKICKKSSEKRNQTLSFY